MSAERVIANTLRLAQADLDAAELLHAGKNRYAVYHCEQAAEKIIKAVLTSEGVHANIKHQLDDMVKQVPDANPLKSLLKQIEHLAAYATTYRYATTSGNIKPSPDDNTLKADMTSVNAALSAAATAFGVDLNKQDQPARTAKAPIVLDANVIVALLYADDSQHQRAVQLTERLEAEGHSLVLIDLLVFEALSVLCRRAAQRKTAAPNLAAAVQTMRHWIDAGGVRSARRGRWTLRRARRALAPRPALRVPGLMIGHMFSRGAAPMRLAWSSCHVR